MDIQLFKSIADQYKVIFFDAFGVLKNYEGLIDGVEETMNYLHERNIGFYVLTNDASRSPAELCNSFQQLGLTDITADKIISSGMLAREYLGYKVKQGTVAYLGTPESAHYLESLALKTISIKNLELAQAEEIEAVVFMDDEGFDWSEDLNKLLNLLRRRNIPVVVANSDHTYPVSKSRIAIAIGAIADMVENLIGKRFLRFGKPDAQMFVFAYDHVQPFHPTDKSEVLMVGDTLETDIIGGNKFGLDTVLVLSGNTAPHQAEQAILSTGITPTYVCDSIAIT
ncbi:HAD-IIA family hydrolase [Tunicatimonas pelagia]|uniref:HAD-IIA family hydrolase n=1 Tax=Tunicatimonas pelagia TaxID=931531 RepID=UPI0026651AE0|nr:HAD-IIA family hydrolase [Tunicatimonas pelagia]WKN43443.1 HAD-IIA family hydrolase [Tunicatimonas pelagia]